MKSTAKAVAWIRDLKEKLEFRFEGSSTIDTFEESRDSEGFPILRLYLASAGATAGNDVIFIRIKGQDAVSKDVFGNSNYSFTPHVMEIAYELDAAGKPEVEQLDLIKALQESFKIGIKSDIYEIADGTAVTEANVNAATAVLEIEPDVIWPTKGM